MYLNRDSHMWRIAGDARVLPFVGTAFLLQAAHPTIAAGVADFSMFQADPFGRFQRSYGLVLDTLYAADGERIGAEVRKAHRSIKGVKPDGTRYSAYEPEAAFWVIATGMETLAVPPMPPPRDRRRAYEEARELARRFGLRDRDMPATLGEFDEWYAWMLAERIEDSPTVRDVVATVRRPAPPSGIPGLPWLLPREIAGRVAWLATMGPLTPAVRERLNIPWSRVDEAQFALFVRACEQLWRLPEHWFDLPPKRAAFARRDEHERVELLAA